MDSVDLSVLKTLREWQAGDLPLWLVTVVETFGSSPRPPGAMLALRGDGLAVGSVSGGCIEDDLVLRAKRGQLASDRCDVLAFGVTSEEARRFRLPCGGVIRVVVEPVQNREPVRNTGLGGAGPATGPCASSGQAHAALRFLAGRAGRRQPHRQHLF